MTFREKLQKEHPEWINEDCLGGCDGCPSDYGYEKKGKKRCVSYEKKCRKCWDRAIPGTEVKAVTKADLKDGMVCEQRGGELMLWLNGALRGINDWYTTGENLKDEFGIEKNDIVKIYVTNGDTLKDMLKRRNLTLIWERKERKEMTLADIERELGYPIKIVSDDNQEA